MSHYLCVLYIFLFCKLFDNFNSAVAKDDGIKPITDDDWLKNIVPSNYDESISPARFKNDNETGVTMKILPISISDISTKKMHFEIELLLLVGWKEPRLPFKEIQNRSSESLVRPPTEFLKGLWSPYLRFTNCKLCDDRRRIGHSEIKHMDVWLHVPKETIYLVYSQTVTFSCYFDLRKYPLDSHTCHIYIELFVLPREKGYQFLKYLPFEEHSASHYVQEYIPAQYKLIDVVFVHKCSNLDPFSVGKPDSECIRISFHFHRLIYNELMLLYLPSTFIVIISWLSFWMDVGASAPRVALGLTSLLTLSTQFANSQNSLPPVSYVKAIDVWMLFCSFSVFCSLIEYFISYQFQDWKMVWCIRNDKSSLAVYPIFKKNHLEVKRMKRIQKAIETSCTKIDFFARIIFPVSFLIFNIIYWSYYA